MSGLLFTTLEEYSPNLTNAHQNNYFKCPLKAPPRHHVCKYAITNVNSHSFNRDIENNIIGPNLTSDVFVGFDKMKFL